MSDAATPAYMGNEFSLSPPGHRFGPYFQGWNKWDWTLDAKNKTPALKKVTGFSPETSRLLAAILKRQQALADQLDGDQIFSTVAKSIAPFTTGTGLEHPLENGFSFLNPYGLPYLPGSGIKGVVRTAAEELAFDPDSPWNILDVWLLFGFEPTAFYLSPHPQHPELREVAEEMCEKFLKQTQSLHPEPATLRSLLQGVGSKKREEFLSNSAMLFKALREEREVRESLRSRGMLSFWDLFPNPEGNVLTIDIMTPHFSHYYQKGETPSDSGQPNPIPFLTIPPGSSFSFIVQLLERRLPPALSQEKRWMALLSDAFTHAFEWIGFGAKSAVGYGHFEKDQVAMKKLQEAKKTLENERKQQLQKQEKWAKMSPLDREIDAVFQQEKDKNKPKSTVLLEALKQEEKWSDPETKKQVAEYVQKIMIAENKWKPKTKAKKPEKDKDHVKTLAIIKFLK